MCSVITDTKHGTIQKAQRKMLYRLIKKHEPVFHSCGAILAACVMVYVERWEPAEVQQVEPDFLQISRPEPAAPTSAIKSPFDGRLKDR